MHDVASRLGFSMQERRSVGPIEVGQLRRLGNGKPYIVLKWCAPRYDIKEWRILVLDEAMSQRRYENGFFVMS